MACVMQGVFSKRNWDIIWFSELDNVHGAIDYLEDLACEFEPHAFYRHYGGVGNTACAVLIHQRMVPVLRRIEWKTRCGACFLQSPGTAPLVVIGVHGCMHSEAQDTLSEASELLQLCQHDDRQICMIGDWNIDISNLIENHANAAGPSLAKARRLLLSWVHSLRCEINFAEQCVTPPGGSWSASCVVWPYTTIPVGDLAAVHTPSLLDFSIVSAGCSHSAWNDWENVPADHSAIGIVVSWNFKCPLKKKTHWHCTDLPMVYTEVEKRWPVNMHDLNIAEFKEWCIKLQIFCQSGDSCASQRAKRLPEEIRNMYEEMRICTSEADRHRLQKQAFEARKKWWALTKSDILCAKVKNGGVVNKTKKLFKVQAVKVEHDLIYGLPAAELINNDFKHKWLGDNLHKVSMLHEWLEKAGAVDVNVTGAELDHAWTVVRDLKKIGPDGLSLGFIKIVAAIQPKAVCDKLDQLLQSDSECKKECVHGRVFGKESVKPSASECRAILPLPALLTLADIILSTRVNKWVAVNMVCPKVCFVGAKPGTQCLDIALCAQLVVEKGLDMKSKAAIATSDIRRFYDSIDLIKIASFLLRNGFDPGTVAACVRCQMLPCVSLLCLGLTTTVDHRASGALTGSRLAGALGHIPINDACMCCKTILEKGALHVADVKTIAFCSWIDNMYTFSNSTNVCVSMLEHIENHLASEWNLAIKLSSRAIMNCRGNIEPVADEAKWPSVSVMNVLGHQIQNDGGIREDWNSTEARMWGAFWANSGNKQSRDLQPAKKALLIYRTVFACILWKISRWPFQKSIAGELDATQCKMLSFVLPCVMNPDEDIDTYCRRRSRLARNVANKVGLWSVMWCERVIAWSAHLKRAQNYHHPCNALINAHGNSWLQSMRSVFVTENSTKNSVLAGRSGTRLNIGRPQVRWSDGFDVAKLVVEGRQVSLVGGNSLSISNRIRDALLLYRVNSGL